jgi:transposase
VARFPLSRRRAVSPHPGTRVAIRRPVPPPSELRRERRRLLDLREQRLRDLGGLMLEMVRRDQFREDLLLDRANELIALEDRLGEIDALLTTALSLRHRPAARCECGTLIAWGSRFCPGCGRPLTPPGPA